MKYVIYVLPFIAIANLAPKQMNVLSISVDTVYMYIPREAHNCPFPVCNLKGQIVFKSPDEDSIDKDIPTIQKVHFDHPNLSWDECVTLWEKESKYARL